MAKGGYRPGAGRKPGYASIAAEKARAYIAEQLDEHLGPIVLKAIEQATEGNQQARDWLSDRSWGKPGQSLEVSNPDGSLKTIIVTKSYAGTDNTTPETN